MAGLGVAQTASSRVGKGANPRGQEVALEEVPVGQQVSGVMAEMVVLGERFDAGSDGKQEQAKVLGSGT